MEDDLILEDNETGTKLINLENFDPDNFENTAYIGGETDFYDFEESKHKNPYREDNSSKESVEKYKTLFYRKLVDDREYRDSVLDLKGKTLMSWMYPDYDHGEVIINFIAEKNKRDFDFKQHVLEEIENIDPSLLGMECLKNKEHIEEKLRNK